MARLFIAVWPPEDVVADLMALRRKDERAVRFVHPDNWHITLRFLGECHIDDVVVAMEGVELPPARAHLGAGVDVLDDRVLVVPVEGLDELATTVTAVTRDLGEPPRKRFVGHLTLARARGRSGFAPPPPRRRPSAERDVRDEGGGPNWRAAMPAAFGARIDVDDFDVHEIALVRSRLHQDGARYETVTTWPVG